MFNHSIIVVDDDPSFRMYLSQTLTTRGYSIHLLEDGDALLAKLTSEPLPSLILLDVMLPGNDGITIIEKMRSAGLKVPVIVVSGAGLVKQVVEAMKAGAADFLSKPFDEEVLDNAIQRVLAEQPEDAAATATADSAEFLTANSEVRRLLQIVKRVATTDVPILITGESGVGKEVMARYAHAHSGRGERRLLKVNCAALPSELLESELFGYERGAFTGAVSDKPGMFELAHNSTLLLDEIGEMSPLLQAKLLHVLQDGVFSRLGGRKNIHVDVRIIATTNIKMAEAISAGTFREDLYFRLNVIAVELPPLRERREDIRALCAHLVKKWERYNRQGRDLPPEVLELFDAYDWPGNIRQLENCIKRFFVLPDTEALFAEVGGSSSDSPTPMVEPDQQYESFSLLNVGANAAERAERDLVRRVLEETGGNRKQAARRMNICYKALLNKMKRWNSDTAAKNQESIMSQPS